MARIELIDETGQLLSEPAERALRVKVISGAGGGGLTDAELRATPVDVAVTTSALPTGAATAAKQDVGNTSVASVDGKLPALVGGRIPVDVTEPVSVDDNGGSLTVDGTVAVSNFPATQPVSAASLPLPTGAATEAKQDTQITALQLLDDTVATVGAASPTVGLMACGHDGTNARRLMTATDGRLLVSFNAIAQPVTAAGDVAHDTGDAGNPVKVGFKAASALPTAVANNDRANGVSDLWGRQLTGHIDPAMQTHINKNYTSQQTGTDVWDPASGKKIAVTSVVIGAYGTTAGRVILWFGDNADTTFTQDTDQVLLAASFAPSASSKPGLVFSPSVPVFCTTADRELHITTDAAISLDITIEGYEW